nr:MAG: RdRP [Stromatinia cryptomeriae mitovirus 1-I]
MKKQTKQQINFEKLKRCLIWVSKTYYADIPDAIRDIDFILKRFEKIYLTRGPITAAKEMKGSRLLLTRWKSGQPLTGSVGVPMSKIDSLPKLLPISVRKSLVSDPSNQYFRWALTLLSISRIVKGDGRPDLKSITDPCSATKLPTGAEIALGLRHLGLKPIAIPQWKRFHWASSAGPNGLSIANAIRDFSYLPSWLKDDLLTLGGDNLRRGFALLEKLIESYSTLADIFNPREKDSFRTKYTRRIAIKPDSEGKSRPFAILDYWSQTALSPLHDQLYRLLELLPQDCTYDQQKGVKAFAGSPKSWIYSLDLTSATDRFPIQIQEAVLSWLTNSDYASAWVRTMVKEEFEYEGQSVSWMTGQPLGAKSSWAMFTIAHHTIMSIACLRSKSDLSNYYILGDDVVIRTKKLAKAYMDIMSELGVSLSDSKSHRAKGFFEFAKTWIYRGQHVSGYPIKGLYETIDQYQELVPIIIETAPMRGYPLPFTVGNLSSFTKSLALIMTPYSRLQNNLNKKMEFAFSFALGTLSDLYEYKEKFLVLAEEQIIPGSWPRTIAEVEQKFKSAVMHVVKTQKAKEMVRLNKFMGDIIKMSSELHSVVYHLSQGRGNFFFNEKGRRTAIFSQEYTVGMMGARDFATMSLSLTPALSISVPVFGALEREIQEGTDILAKYNESDPLKFWDNLKTWELRPFPQLKGLVARRIKWRSQATSSLALKAAKHIKIKDLEHLKSEKESASNPQIRPWILIRRPNPAFWRLGPKTVTYYSPKDNVGTVTRSIPRSRGRRKRI